MNVQKKLRIALVGLGTWAGQGHLPLYHSHRFRFVVEVSALCSRSLEKARQWAKDFDVPSAYDNYDQLLNNETLDAVVVCTPDHVHYDYIMSALDRGFHVLVEKPMAMDLDQSRAIVAKAKEKQKKVITLFHKRADPLWAEAGRRIRAGEFGAFRMGWAGIQNPVIVPNSDYFMSDLAAHSDPNWFLGTHFYDLLRYMTGLNPITVRAHRFKNNTFGQLSENTDSIKADFIFENQGALSVFLSWNLSKNYPSLTKQDMRLHFDNGELDLDGTQRGFTQDSPNGYKYVNPYFMRNNSVGIAGYAADFLESAIISILDADQPLPVDLPTLEDAWWASSMAGAVETSAENNEIINIEAFQALLYL
ncbi:MAG: Gfo/Idh/MocA family protein [Desulfobacterales bacterium]